MYIHRRRDPINQLIKLKFIVITINNLPFIFVQFLAFYCKNTFSSIACSSFKFGDNCASTCTCVQANSESCNNVDGKCSCKAGYTGSNCDSGKHIPLLMGDCTIDSLSVGIGHAQYTTCSKTEWSNFTFRHSSIFCSVELFFYKKTVRVFHRLKTE